MAGVCMAGGVHGKWGCAWRGGGGLCVVGETATAADGTHTTGIHSCFHCILMALFSLRVEQNKCAETICQHDGTCTEDYENHTYHCACVTGYDGVDCHKRKSRVPLLEDFFFGGGRDIVGVLMTFVLATLTFNFTFPTLYYVTDPNVSPNRCQNVSLFMTLRYVV